MTHNSLLFNVMMSVWSRPPPYKLYHSFHIPTLDLREGIRHIHSLERIQSLQYNNHNFLRIVNSSKPFRIGEYAYVGLNCLMMNKPQQLKIYTNAINQNTVLCMDASGRQEASLRLVIKPAVVGSIISLNTTIYRSPRWISNALQPFLNFLLFYKKNGNIPVVKYDQNLTLYRRMVIGS